jgi:hypothetical protein
MRWVRSYEQALPRLIEEGFPGKQKVLARHREKLTALQQRLDEGGQELEKRQALHAPASRMAEKLRSVDPSYFRKALAKGADGAPVPAWYLEGVYAPWESPPDWFITLLSEYGG